MALCANQIKALSLSANQKTSWKYDFEYSPHFVDIFSMHGSFFQSFFGSFFRFQFFHLFCFFFIYLDFCLPRVTDSGFQRSFQVMRLLWGHIEVILRSFGVILQWKPTRVAISIHIFVQLRIKILLWRDVFQTRLAKNRQDLTRLLNSLFQRY